MLFSIADHDFPHISIPHHFQCFCHSSYFESPSNIFWCCFGTIIPVVTRFCTFSLLLTCPKKVAWRLLILFMLNLVVSASCNSFGWFLYSPWDFLILLSPVSFVTFEIVQALYWYIRMGSIEHFRALLFVRIEMWLFVSIDFILWKLSLSYVHHLILKYPSIWIDPFAWVYYLW